MTHQALTSLTPLYPSTLLSCVLPPAQSAQPTWSPCSSSTLTIPCLTPCNLFSLLKCSPPDIYIASFISYKFYPKYHLISEAHPDYLTKIINHLPFTLLIPHTLLCFFSPHSWCTKHFIYIYSFPKLECKPITIGTLF